MTKHTQSSGSHHAGGEGSGGSSHNGDIHCNTATATAIHYSGEHHANYTPRRPWERGFLSTFGGGAKGEAKKM